MIKNFELNLSKNEFFLRLFVDNNFENRLFASIQMIIPKVKIAIIKIFWWAKLMKNNKNNKIIDVINLFIKFCDIKSCQSFFWFF